MQPISRDVVEPYTWGGRCRGWHLVQAEGLSVIEEEMPPGTSERLHRHARARQFFHVLRGTLTMELDGGIHELRAGQGMEVPPSTAHRVRNTGKDVAGFLVISQPPSHGDREDL